MDNVNLWLHRVKRIFCLLRIRRVNVQSTVLGRSCAGLSCAFVVLYFLILGIVYQGSQGSKSISCISHAFIEQV